MTGAFFPACLQLVLTPCWCLLQAMVAFTLLLIVEGFKGGPGLIPGGGAPSGL